MCGVGFLVFCGCRWVVWCNIVYCGLRLRCLLAFGFVGLVWIAVCEFLRRALVGLVSGAAVGLGFELCGSGFWAVSCLVWAIWVLGLVCGVWFAGFGWIVGFCCGYGFGGFGVGGLDLRGGLVVDSGCLSCGLGWI